MEFHYLIFSGPTTPQMRSQRLSEFWGQGDIYAKDFGMESFDEFYSRVRVFLQRLRSISDDANIVVFTHGFLLQAILYQLENGFPESSSLVMKEIHERCFLRPIGNGEVIVFDKSELFGI
ncbi:Histidine phosphatase superfamily (branch 1) [Propionivibrio dicarboxylicus]|uniref:Histidine phosphatase superfamily (Branch 1) n=2 Tax=Propionivibrio dicarboxylicus TaxID=83767 RepID=A0A1G8NKF5_9RHOO|nr:Histidine phosphatase superfamily (branch 1) [Propionivibrio dicarboxylicus]